MNSFLGYSFGFIPVSDTNASSEITGSGTVNTLAMFTAGQVIGNSFLSQNGNNVRLALGKYFSNVGGSSVLDLGNGSNYLQWTNDAGVGNDAILYIDTAGFNMSSPASSVSISGSSTDFSLSGAGGLFRATTLGIGANTRGVQMNASLMQNYHALNITNQSLSLVNTQIIGTSGSPTFALWTGAAHTTLAAGIQATDINFNLARTVQFATGAITTQRAFLIQAPTYTFVSASTITNAATCAITGAPVSGTNATITNSYALWVQAGRVQFDGTINGLTLTNTTGTFTLANAKTLTVSNTLTFTGTDSSSVNFAAGGTVAYLASPAFTGNPTAPTQSANDNSTKLATTAYVDAAVSGLDVKPDVAYVSLLALPANTYNNGTLGVGATLTGNSNGPLIIDGVTILIGQAGERVLIAAESASANNGWYTITQVGVVAVSPYILTRAVESDQAAEIGAGYLTGVVAPNTVTPGTNNGKLYISVAADPFTVGTTPLTFSQVGGTYGAGNGLTLSGTTFSINTTITADLTTIQTLTNKTLTSPTFTSPVLGTPSSGTLTNCTGLPLAGIVNATATQRLIGRNTAAAGAFEEVTQSQLKAWGNWVTESAEANSTPVTVDAEGTMQNIRSYAYFVMPSTELWYIITGIEWFNGATVNGNVFCGVDLVDANPPTISDTSLVAWGSRLAQANTNSVQRNSMIASTAIRGGTLVGAWINSGSATGTFQHQSGASSQNQTKSLTAGAPPVIESTAFTAQTIRKYIKIYFRGIK